MIQGSERGGGRVKRRNVPGPILQRPLAPNNADAAVQRALLLLPLCTSQHRKGVEQRRTY
jgi:hypothetical protein